MWRERERRKKKFQPTLIARSIIFKCDLPRGIKDFIWWPVTIVSISFGRGDRITDLIGGIVGLETCKMYLFPDPCLLPFPHPTGVSHDSTYNINPPTDEWCELPTLYLKWREMFNIRRWLKRSYWYPRGRNSCGSCGSVRRLPGFGDPFPNQALTLFGLTAVLRWSSHLIVIVVLGLSLSPLPPFQVLTVTAFPTLFLNYVQYQPGWDNRHWKN